MIEYLGAYPFVLKKTGGYLFFNPKTKQHIKRGQAWKFIRTICQEVGMQGVDLALILYKHNRNNIAYARRYFGITDDELQAIAQRLNL